MHPLTFKYAQCVPRRHPCRLRSILSLTESHDEITVETLDHDGRRADIPAGAYKPLVIFIRCCYCCYAFYFSSFIQILLFHLANKNFYVSRSTKPLHRTFVAISNAEDRKVVVKVRRILRVCVLRKIKISRKLGERM